jgi:hypothetical protein
MPEQLAGRYRVTVLIKEAEGLEKRATHIRAINRWQEIIPNTAIHICRGRPFDGFDNGPSGVCSQGSR